MKTFQLTLCRSILALLAIAFLAFAAAAQTTAFTYQGRLTDSTVGGNGSYLMKFELYSDASGSNLIDTLNDIPASVLNGVFTVQLSFTAANAFDGADRFLKISVKRNAGESYTPLTPLQPITSTPYSIKAKNATLADISTNTLNVGGTPAANVIKEGDARLTDNRNPASGSGNYIQNQNSAAQISTNFRIDGAGAANVFDAGAGFNIGGSRVLSVAGTQNFFAGRAAGNSNTTGAQNTFVGESAGTANTTGRENAFFGFNAGFSNTAGRFNSFFGRNVGNSNTSADSNSFFGFNAGFSNTTGSGNVFVGRDAGFINVTGGNNTFVGTSATAAADNLNYASAFGAGAVAAQSNSVVLGRAADTVQIPGNLNVAGTFTAAINGSGITNLNASNIASGTLNNARLGVVPTANGGTGLSSSGTAGNFLRSNGTTWASSAIQAADVPNLDAGKITTGTFGAARIPDLSQSYIQNQTSVQSSSNFNISGSGTAGGTLSANLFNAATQYNLGGSRALKIDSNSNAFVGDNGGQTTGGSDNSYFGVNTGGFFNSGGGFNTTGSNNTLVGARATMGFPALNYATAVGAGARVNVSNTIVLGRENGTDRVLVPGQTLANGLINAYGGISVENSAIFLKNGGDINHRISYNSNIDGIQFTAYDRFLWFNAASSTVVMQLDGNGNLGVSGFYGQFSDARYKTNVQTFAGALDAVRRLRGVTFNWKPEASSNPKTQIGFIAQEVEAVLPEIVSTDKDGYKSVAYSNAVPVLVEAVKEQQTQIERQTTQLERQQKQIAELKQIVCAIKPDAKICQPEEK